MTLRRRHLQLESAEKKAERALKLAIEGRSAFEAAIDELERRLDVLQSGSVDFGLGQEIAETEQRLHAMLKALEKFERDVAEPAEELRFLARDQRRAFEASLARNRSESSVRFSNSSAEFRTNDLPQLGSP